MIKRPNYPIQKICPLLSIGKGIPEECRGEQCMFLSNAVYPICSIAYVGIKLDQILVNIEAIVDEYDPCSVLND